jgi:acyl-CoA thioesterase-2
MPDVPLAESLPEMAEWHAAQPEPIDRPGAPHVVSALEFRPVSGVMGRPGHHGVARDPDQDTWLRVKGTLPAEPLLHACVVAYASDLTLLGTATLPHPVPDDAAGYMVASLDHVMWFHRPCRADEWLLYHVHSPSAGAARGFAQGSLFRSDGTLAVSIAQEGLVRPLR